MSDRLKELRERSQKRKQLLAQAFGLSSPEGLKDALMSKNDRDEAKKKTKREEKKSSTPEREGDDVTDAVIATEPGASEPQLVSEFGEDHDEEEEEEEVYTDSSTFLKGTQSENPHNDYCQHFLDTGERPQNFIRDVGLANRFEEYPKLRELIKLKDELIEKTNTPPMYLHCDMDTFDLNDLGSKFDVILIEPPLEEHQRSQGAVYDKYWAWDEISRLDIGGVSAQRSFVWMWCGNSEGLEWGRECLRLWGFRRCEDICWIKTNIKNPGHNKYLEPNALFQTTKEHCIMGIKGTVKRSTDGDYIHSNVDIDLLIAEDPEYGCKDKPTEIFHLIEHFCLGRRRLHIFGRDSTLRPGWLTIGTEVTSSNFDPEVYANLFNKPPGLTTGYTDDIERLRPKSPPARMMGGDDYGGRGRGDSHGSGPGRGYGGPMRGGSRGFRPRGRGDNMHRPHLPPR